MKPTVDGLPAIDAYKGPDGDDVLLFRGIESATNAIRKGRAVSPSMCAMIETLFARVAALKDAYEHRVKMQNGEQK